MRTADFIALIAAIVSMSILGIMALLLVNYMRPGVDNTNLDIIILGFLATNIAPLLNLIKNYQMADKQEKISDKQDVMHEEVTQGVKQSNGLIQDLLKSTADNATLTEKANEYARQDAKLKEHPSDLTQEEKQA